jgi:hypothetical protein
MKKIFAFCFLINVVFVSAQRYKIISGSLDNLKGISEYKVNFDYTNLKVNDFATEEDFLKEKMDKRQDRENKAQLFKKNWYDDRANKYEPKFIEYFNNRFQKGELKISTESNSKYLMTVKTTWIYPGYVVEPAKITATILISAVGNPKPLLEIQFEKVIGIEDNAYNGDQGYRIAGAYEKLAKLLTIQLKRVL